MTTPVPDEIRKAAHDATTLPLGQALQASPYELIDLAVDAVYPLIVAAEHERIRSMAIEHQATYRPYDADLGRLIPGFDGCPGPDPLGDPFADLLGEDA